MKIHSKCITWLKKNKATVDVVYIDEDRRVKSNTNIRKNVVIIDIPKHLILHSTLAMKESKWIRLFLH